jgi:paraquat-inducible protein A
VSQTIQLPNTIACRVCGQAHLEVTIPPGMVAKCCRCGSVIERRSVESLHRTAALSLSALILFVPANVFPILHMEMYGATTDNTVWQGVQSLYREGEGIIALIVLLASIVIPLLKLIGLFFLVTTVHVKWKRLRRVRTRLYQFIEAIGRWAMLDVFVLALLVSVVKLRQLATVIAGPGALAFAGVVVFTLLASASFDPQLIWENEEEPA